MTEKSWFIMRYPHFPPESIKLGQLITDPTEPHILLDPSGLEASPANLPSYRTLEEHFEWEATSSPSGHGGLSAAADGVPLSAEISGEFKKTQTDWAKFGSLETQLIIPTSEFVKDSMMRPVVRQELGKSLLLKRVFMITGVKIARGASTGRETSCSSGGIFKVGVTPTPTIPVSLGPSGGFGKSKSESVTSQGSDFVWAFSLRQIYYRWGQITESSTYKDGATLEDRISEANTIGQAISSPSSRGEVMVVDGSKPFSGEGSGLVSVQEVHAIGDDIHICHGATKRNWFFGPPFDIPSNTYFITVSDFNLSAFRTPSKQPSCRENPNTTAAMPEAIGVATDDPLAYLDLA
ncbi:hypothetical protein HYFRA_00010591 [Hymenoscyphus fraxineus]|uniref:Uncharacterized protein n=1 Tax=Hymenoscyphus fraxineus TaxID=746836 RepID=A0A9N9PZV2_9HELO|nr:hypothetical protein HYFRA_00010591 [Hymenoscyphus fraxineus]